VEAGRIAVAAGEVERRKVGLGEKPDAGDVRDIRPLRAPARIPETRHAGGDLQTVGFERQRLGLRARAQRRSEQESCEDASADDGRRTTDDGEERLNKGQSHREPSANPLSVVCRLPSVYS